MKTMKHTWYYKVTENGKVIYKKVKMERPAINGKRCMMASINAMEINELKQNERNKDFALVTKEEYNREVVKQ